MRKLSKPSTAKCTGSLYILFLLAEPKYVSCVRLAEVMEEWSHDSVNRLLLREHYTPRDLFETVKDNLILVGGIASVDASVLDKPYSAPQKTALMGYFWSGKHQTMRVKGLIDNLYQLSRQ